MDLISMLPYLGAIMLAALLDIASNMFITKSNGFKNKKLGFLSLFLVALAFTCLAFAVRKLDLAVAYASWGALGILGTSLGGWIFFKQKLRPFAWLGIASLICGIVILNVS